MSAPGTLLRARVRGLQVDVQGLEGGVVHMTVGAQQQHQGSVRRLRQHLADALFGLADLLHPGHDGLPTREVQLVVPQAAADGVHAGRRGQHIVELPALRLADGQRHYNSAIVYQGVECTRLERWRLAVRSWLGLKEAAHDPHALVSLAPVLKGRSVTVCPDPAAQRHVPPAARWLLLAAVLAGAAMLTACGGGGDEPQPPDVQIKPPPCTVEPRPAICQ